MYEAIRDKYQVEEREVECLLNLRADPDMWTTLQRQVERLKGQARRELENETKNELIFRSQGAIRMLDLFMLNIFEITQKAKEEKEKHDN